MTHALDLTKRHFTINYTSLILIGTWLRRDDMNYRPCMVLVPSGREYDERMVPCVITQDKAWIWSEEIGDPVAALSTAISFAETLGLAHHDKRTVIRLAMFINDHLSDLLSIPPHPDAYLQDVAEVTMRDNSGRTVEAVLRD